MVRPNPLPLLYRRARALSLVAIGVVLLVVLLGSCYDSAATLTIKGTVVSGVDEQGTDLAGQSFALFLTFEDGTGRVVTLPAAKFSEIASTSTSFVGKGTLQIASIATPFSFAGDDSSVLGRNLLLDETEHSPGHYLLTIKVGGLGGSILVPIVGPPDFDWRASFPDVAAVYGPSMPSTLVTSLSIGYVLLKPTSVREDGVPAQCFDAQESGITAATSQAANSPQTFPGEQAISFSASAASPPGPGQHLAIFYGDTLESISATTPFATKPISVFFSTAIGCEKASSDEWKIISGPPGATLSDMSARGATLHNPHLGGLYKVTHRLNSVSIPSEAIVVLPLAGAEVKAIMQNDIARANRFLKTFGNYTLLYQNYLLLQMGLPRQIGNYLGRPDSKTTPTVWLYNQVSDTGALGNSAGKGAVATWYGVPVRTSKLSNFIVAYTVQRLGVSPALQKLAQGLGTQNDRSGDDSWTAGVDLASGKITLADMPPQLRLWFGEMDNTDKTRRLWPNPNLVDDFVQSDMLHDVDTQFTHPGFLDLSE